MNDDRDLLERDLPEMFSRRANDVPTPLRLPAPIRRQVRRRQAGRIATASVTICLLALGAAALVRTSGAAEGTRPAAAPSAEPTYAPPAQTLPDAPPMRVAASGATGSFRWRLLASGDPAGGTIETEVVTAPRDAGRWSPSGFQATLDHLGDPLDARVLEVRTGAAGRPSVNLIWGSYLLGVAEIQVQMRGCAPVTVHRAHAIDVGPPGVEMPVWLVATRCTPTRISARTILGAQLGSRPIPADHAVWPA